MQRTALASDAPAASQRRSGSRGSGGPGLRCPPSRSRPSRGRAGSDPSRTGGCRCASPGSRGRSRRGRSLWRRRVGRAWRGTLRESVDSMYRVDRARRGGSGALSPAIRSSGAEFPNEGLRLSGSVRRTEASMAGSRAASAREPGQIREEAALSDTARAPRISLAGADDRRARPRSSFEDGCTVRFSQAELLAGEPEEAIALEPLRDRRRDPLRTVGIERDILRKAFSSMISARTGAVAITEAVRALFARGRSRRGSRPGRDRSGACRLRQPPPCPPRSRRTVRELALVDQPLAGLELDLAELLGQPRR